jgi:uncharacterized membrane protein YkvA (DUF1232 family)
MKRIAVLLRIAKSDLRVLWFALRHPDRPVWLLPSVVLVALYALSPINIAMPLIGLIDDGMLVPLILHLLVTCLPEPLRSRRSA